MVNTERRSEKSSNVHKDRVCVYHKIHDSHKIEHLFAEPFIRWRLHRVFIIF